MSHLKLYWPELQEGTRLAAAAAQERQVLPFEPLSRRFDVTGAADPIQRARIIYHNRRCPKCDRPVVEPLDLSDGIRNRNGMQIPGTSTLVGFFCQRCDSEWSL